MPEADNLTVGILAVVAEREREAIADRTRSALAAAKARGVRLGNPNGAAALHRAGKGNVAAVAANQGRAAAWADERAALIEEARAAGATSLRGLAEWLNVKGVQAPRGGLWQPTTVKRLLGRLGVP
jgi:DNA invertase Pin-like site-specific DNA recombinase